MLDRLLHPLRESFSGKIIALVSASVVVTSIVVGLVTIRSTKRFLSEKDSKYGLKISQGPYTHEDNIYNIPFYGIESIKN